MVDFILQAILSNLLFSSVIALIALAVQKSNRYASLAHLLWVIVLVKMLTPPLFSIPLLEVSSIGDRESIFQPEDRDLVADQETQKESREQNNDWGDLEDQHTEGLDTTDSSMAMAPSFLDPHSNSSSSEPGEDFLDSSTGEKRGLWYGSIPLLPELIRFLSAVWVVVSLALLVVSMTRIIGFHFRLRESLVPPSERLLTISKALIGQFNLNDKVQVCESLAQVSPFVWWVGRKPMLIIPQTAIESLSDSDLRHVVAHEMAHIRRKDHWVRWLEWLAVLILWWNPIMWWVRKQLRATEELACDAMVIESSNTKRYEYASSLLNMAELLTTSAIRPPAIASAMTSGGTMEQRLMMIMSGKNLGASTGMRAMIAMFALCVFPLGLVYAQDFEAVEKRLGGAVEAGEISLDQAAIMLEALKDSAKNKERNKDRYSERKMEVQKDRYVQATNKIKNAIKEGKLSKRDGEKRLIALKQKMFGNEGHEHDGEDHDGEDHEREMAELKERYMMIAREIEMAIKKGKMSKEDGQRKLIEIREEMFGDHDDHEHDGEDHEEGHGEEDHEREMAVRKERYMMVAREIEMAIKKGKMSKEDGQRKLIEIREEMFGDHDDHEHDGEDHEEGHGDEGHDEGDEREMAKLKERYMMIAREIEMAIKKGKVSKEDGQRKLIEIREEMFGDHEDHEHDGEDHEEGHGEEGHDEEGHDEGDEREMAELKERYMMIAREIEMAIKKGKMSKEDGQRKLIEIREEMFGDHTDREHDGEDHEEGHDESDEREMAKLRERYMMAAREIEMGIKKGKISKEVGLRELNKIRKEMFGDRDRDDDEDVEEYLDREHEGDRDDYVEDEKEVDERDRELAELKKKYLAYQREVEELVEAGEISKEAAEKRLIQLRKKMFPNFSDKKEEEKEEERN